MALTIRQSLTWFLERLPPAAAFTAIAMGALVLYGWLFDQAALKSVLPGLTVMKVNTALGFILCGISLLASARAQRLLLLLVAEGCAFMAWLIGLLTLGEYQSGLDFGIDQLVIRETTTLPGDIPGRMAVGTAISFSSLGAALLLLAWEKAPVMAIQALAAVVFVAAGSALMAYAYDIEPLARERLRYTPMALHTAIAFVLLALGAISARPDYPFRRFASCDCAAGWIVRRLLPAAIALIVVSGWLISKGCRIGYFSWMIGLSLFAAANITGLGGLILWFAARLTKAYAEREKAEERNRYLAAIVASSDDAIIGTTLDGVITSWNRGAERSYGYSEGEAVGQPMSLLSPPAYGDELLELLERIRAGGHLDRFDARHRKKDGMEIDVSVSIAPIRSADGGIVGAASVARDITERKRSEKALARANRALRTLSAGNEAMVRAASEEELLRESTRAIVENGGYRMAAVGYAENDPEKTIAPKAWFGAEIDFFLTNLPSWSDTERGQVPIARAIRSGQMQICRHIAAERGFKPWREAALARGYASNIVLPLSDGGKTFGALSIYSSDVDAFDEEEAELLRELADDLAYGIITLRIRAERDRIAHEREQLSDVLQQSLEQTVRAIADTVEMRDRYTAGHQRRVGELAVAIAWEMGLSQEKILGIHLAAIVHDVGKIRIPAEILSRPGRLGDIEFQLIQTHPQAGYDILKDVNFPWPIAEIVWQHHEKLDGSGYPQGLKGEDILLEARIMAVADIVEAMSAHRPYRPALGIGAALRAIEQGRGSLYDPAVVDACMKLFREGRFEFSSTAEAE